MQRAGSYYCKSPLLMLLILIDFWRQLSGWGGHPGFGVRATWVLITGLAATSIAAGRQESYTHN